MQLSYALWALLHILGLLLMTGGVEGLYTAPRQLKSPSRTSSSSPAGAQTGSVGVISSRVYWWLGYRSKYRSFGTSYRWLYVSTTPYYYVGPGPADKVGYSSYEAPFNPWWPVVIMVLVINVELSVLCCLCAFRT